MNVNKSFQFASFLAGCAAFLFGLALPVSIFAQAVVYEADFESGAPPEFSTGSTSNQQIGAEAVNQGLSTYLGKFTLNDQSTLTVNGLSQHAYVRLEFDVYFFQSWDGSNVTYGPDYFSLSGDITFSETFTNHHGSVESPEQSYPALADVYLNSDGSALEDFGSGDRTFAYFSLGPSSSGTAFVVPHNSDTFSVTFGGPTTQADEQWGIDNVEVTICDTMEECLGAAPPPQAIATQPVPLLNSWLSLFALIVCFVAGGFLALRR